MSNPIEVPHPLPKGYRWVEWLGGSNKQIAAAHDGDTHHIWTYRPDLIGHIPEKDTDPNENMSVWRVRAEKNDRILGYADTFDEACKFISLYMMMGMHNET